MKHWYYADEARQPQGPVDAATLRDWLAGGQIPYSTLVWRSGLVQWQPVADLAGELGLDITPRPSHPSPVGPAEIPSPADAPSSDDDASPARFDDDGDAVAGFAHDASPYAAPQATVGMASPVVQGGDVVYAGFWKRTAAFAIDNFLLIAINSVVGVVVGMAMVMLMLDDGNNGDSPAMLVLQGASYLVQLAISVAYFGWFHASTHQATPGKMAVGIKVVDRNGAPIGFWRSVGRYFATFISMLLLLAGYVMAAFTGRRQALHDLICGTLVVDKWAYTHHPERQRPELGTVTWIVLVLGGLLALLSLLAMGALFAALGGAFGR